jgi:shikimate kinase
MANILLVGARASGKTAVGRRASARLGAPWRFLEMDQELVTRLGMPIADFFARMGEAAFREAERALLAEIGTGNRQIVACGGGVAGTAESLAAARAGGTLIWLETPAPVLIARRLTDPDEEARPALLPALAALKATDLEGYLHVEVPTILGRRQSYYAAADFTLATEGLDVERLAVIVAALAAGA